MNNPFATVPTPAQPALQANPFAPQAPVQQHQPSFPTSAPTANPFAAVVQAPPPAPPAQTPTVGGAVAAGFAAIQAAFAFPPLNPPGEAGLGLQPVATAPVQVEAPAAPVAPEPATKARRSRKAKADVLADIDAALLRDDVQEAVDRAEQAACVNRLIDLSGDAPTLESATTEELRDALNARGWNVTLVAS